MRARAGAVLAAFHEGAGAGIHEGVHEGAVEPPHYSARAIRWAPTRARIEWIRNYASRNALLYKRIFLFNAHE